MKFSESFGNKELSYIPGSTFNQEFELEGLVFVVKDGPALEVEVIGIGESNLELLDDSERNNLYAIRNDLKTYRVVEGPLKGTALLQDKGYKLSLEEKDNKFVHENDVVSWDLNNIRIKVVMPGEVESARVSLIGSETEEKSSEFRKEFVFGTNKLVVVGGIRPHVEVVGLHEDILTWFQDKHGFNIYDSEGETLYVVTEGPLEGAIVKYERHLTVLSTEHNKFNPGSTSWDYEVNVIKIKIKFADGEVCDAEVLVPKGGMDE